MYMNIACPNASVQHLGYRRNIFSEGTVILTELLRNFELPLRSSDLLRGKTDMTMPIYNSESYSGARGELCRDRRSRVDYILIRLHLDIVHRAGARSA